MIRCPSTSDELSPSSTSSSSVNSRGVDDLPSAAAEENNNNNVDTDTNNTICEDAAEDGTRDRKQIRMAAAMVQCKDINIRKDGYSVNVGWGEIQHTTIYFCFRAVHYLC